MSMKLLCGFALILLMLTENLEGVHGDARYTIIDVHDRHL